MKTEIIFVKRRSYVKVYGSGWNNNNTPLVGTLGKIIYSQRAEHYHFKQSVLVSNGKETMKAILDKIIELDKSLKLEGK